VVFFNYTTMQVSAKIVYYGPGLCGKTTNLQQIHGRTDPGSRGEMVSLETEADRTLFFDLLPLEVGTIGGMRVRLQLYTVPGQVFYNTTRKLVLKGVDGIVFVADSQEPALDANVESLKNLRQNLAELNQPLEKIPFVFQYNKRDLRNIVDVETLDRYLNPGQHDVFEGAALHGVGVFETLKAISKKTLAAVHRKISGEPEPEKTIPAVSVPVMPPNKTSKPQPGASQGNKDKVVATAKPARETASGTSDVLFQALEDDLDPDAVAITEERETPSPVAEAARLQEANTSEVKIEFAANPNLSDETVTNREKKPSKTETSLTPQRKVATKSRVDIERQLEELRKMAFGKDRSVEKSVPPPEVLLVGEGSIVAPAGVLEKATGVLLDVKIVGEGVSHNVSGAVRVELPPHKPGEHKRLRVELDLAEEE
jgi:signal recognition particle receptor subunit beta